MIFGFFIYVTSYKNIEEDNCIRHIKVLTSKILTAYNSKVISLAKLIYSNKKM